MFLEKIHTPYLTFIDDYVTGDVEINPRPNVRVRDSKNSILSSNREI